MAGGIIGSVSHGGDLGQHGVDHDNAVSVHLGQTALSADLGHSIQCVNGVVSAAGLAVDIATPVRKKFLFRPS